MNPFLDGLAVDLRRIGERARAEFGPLDADGLSRRPADGGWSVGECLDHLRQVNRRYLERIEPAIRRARRREVFGTGPYRGGILGRAFVRWTGPEAPFRIPAPRIFRPASARHGPDVVDAFVSQQDELVAVLERADGLDLDRITVRSPVTPLIRFRLTDAFRILVGHEKRHLEQARRASPGGRAGPRKGDG